MTGVRAAAAAALAAMVPTAVWTVAAVSPAGSERYLATVRTGLDGLWTALAVMATILGPAMAATGARRTSVEAWLVLIVLPVPWLVLAWLTGAVAPAALARGMGLMAAWAALAMVTVRATARAGGAGGVATAGLQLGMLALVAGAWQTWIDWIGP